MRSFTWSNFHAGRALEQFGHDAFARRVQVLNDDKCHAAIPRHVRQKMLQGLQASGGSADADDRELAAPLTVRRELAASFGRRFRSDSRFILFLHITFSPRHWKHITPLASGSDILNPLYIPVAIQFADNVSNGFHRL